MRAWGGLGRPLDGLCQAESYLLEGMGARPLPPVGPKETETPFSSPLAPEPPSLYLILITADFFFAEEFEKVP